MDTRYLDKKQCWHNLATKKKTRLTDKVKVFKLF